MRFLALAVDYDGTLAHEGQVSDASVAALERVVASGRKLILVTGRELNELLEIFPRIDLFARVVAENGALLYRPETRESKLLALAPPPAFIQELHRRNVSPLSIGGSIVATVHPNETVVLDIIRELGLELHVIFNKGSVMVLPSGVNKATGLKCALEELNLSPHNGVAAGDGENDHALLQAAELGVAVANAVPQLKESADHVTAARNGGGVTELIDGLIESDLEAIGARLQRRSLLLGSREERQVLMPAFGPVVLATGTSGGGKSTFASALVEQLIEKEYQCCIIDPEGDYETFPGVISLGDATRTPGATEIVAALEKPATNVAVNLLGVKLEDRPAYFLELLAYLQELRHRTGRPHWILVDEAHHVLPADRPAMPVVKARQHSMIYVTVEPKTVNADVLRHVDVVAAFGEAPAGTIREFCETVQVPAPEMPALQVQSGETVLWLRQAGEGPIVVKTPPNKSARRRHLRKYAHGELSEEESFYFRGPKEALNLRAQNLQLFTQIAAGVDDDTWNYHLRRGDYSDWMKRCIKDDALAQEAREIEAHKNLPPLETRRLIREAVERHYTLPASAKS